MFVEDCLRPFRHVPLGRGGGGEFDHQPVDEQLQADRLVPGVEVSRQFACLYRVCDSCGERVLQALRGKGHEFVVRKEFASLMGRGQAVMHNSKTGMNYAGSDPRADGVATPEPLPLP